MSVGTWTKGREASVSADCALIFLQCFLYYANRYANLLLSSAENFGVGGGGEECGDSGMEVGAHVGKGG